MMRIHMLFRYILVTVFVLDERKFPAHLPNTTGLNEGGE